MRLSYYSSLTLQMTGTIHLQAVLTLRQDSSITHLFTGVAKGVDPRFGELIPAVGYHFCLNLPAAFT